MNAIDKLRELGLLPEETATQVGFMLSCDCEDCRDIIPAIEALAAVALEQANEVQRTQSDMREGFGGWVKETARSDEAEALLNKAKAYVPNALWDEIHDWYGRRADEAEALNNGHLEGISRDGGPSLDEQRSAWDKQR